MTRIPASVREGVFLRSDALAEGLDDDQIARAVRRGEWHRIRRGAFCAGDDWANADARGRHLATARAVARQIDGSAALSHATAAVALGLPLYDVPLDLVHVTRGSSGHGRREAAVAHHVGSFHEGDVVDVGGLRVLSPARTALDVAREWGEEPGLVTADAALHTTPLRQHEMAALAATMTDWPGARAASAVAARADPRAESPGESLSRLVVSRLGWDLEPQVEVVDARGLLVGRVDGLIVAEDVVVEFDGRGKYGDDESDVREALWREKIREDLLRAMGFEVVRITWADLHRPWIIGQRLQAAVARSRDRGRYRVPSGPAA
jgi:hypothetical protein